LLLASRWPIQKYIGALARRIANDAPGIDALFGHHSKSISRIIAPDMSL
jgi:hypothetical protein